MILSVWPLCVLWTILLALYIQFKKIHPCVSREVMAPEHSKTMGGNLDIWGEDSTYRLKSPEAWHSLAPTTSQSPHSIVQTVFQTPFLSGGAFAMGVELTPSGRVTIRARTQLIVDESILPVG